MVMVLKCLGSSSKGNCYLLVGKNETLILEAGVNFMDIKKAINFDISKVCGCAYSHNHLDHSRSITKIADSGIDVFCTNGSNPFSRHRNIHEILKYKEVQNVGGFKVVPIPTIHEGDNPCAFVIDHKEMGRMLFVTDSASFNYAFKDVSHILIEANYCPNIVEKQAMGNPAYYNNLERLEKSHMSIDDAEMAIGYNISKKTRNIVLLHLSDGNSDENEFKTRIQKKTGLPVYIANEKLEIEL